MREIFFRGKCKTDNEWLYGFPYVTRKNAVKINWYCSEFGSMRTDEVDPETVGQYTGLTDKNGVRIFEGDILKSTIKIIDCDDEGFSISHYDKEDIGIVEWRKDGFMIAHKSGTWARSFYGCENYVIGNIHDNPELLGGENNGINR